MADTAAPTPPPQDDIDQVLAGYGVNTSGTAPRVLAPAASDEAARILNGYGVTLKPGAAPPVDTAAARGINIPDTKAPPNNRGLTITEPGEYFPPGEVKAGRERGVGAQFVSGIPVLGPLVNLGVAAASPNTPGAPPTFEQRFYEQQQADRAFATEHPWLSTTANLAGGTIGYGGIARMVPSVLGMTGATTGLRMVQGAAGSSGLNALDAVLRGENPLAAAEVGAGSGFIAPAAGSISENVLNTAAHNFWPRPNALNNVPRQGITILARGLEGETPQSIAEATARMGPHGFFADINPQTTDIAGAIADMSTPERTAIQSAYRARAAGQGGRIDDALTKATGVPGNFNIVDYSNFLERRRAQEAGPLYDQWRNMSVTPTDRLTNNIIPRLQKAGAFDEAEHLAGITGETSPQSEMSTQNLDSQIQQAFKNDDQARVTQLIQRKNELIADSMTPQKYDLVKRGLDSKIEQAYSAGNKTVASRLVQLKNDLIDEIGQTDAGHVWNEARQGYADRSALIDQLEAGYNSPLGGRSAQSVDEFREEWNGLTGPERAARVMGWRKMVAEGMGESGNAAGITRGKLLSPNNQAKLRIMLPDSADDLINTLQSEKDFSDRLPAVVPNWNTGASGATRAQRAQMFAPQSNALASWMPDISLENPLRIVPSALRPGTLAEDFAGQRAARIPPSLVPLLLTPQSEVPNVASSIMSEGRRIANTSSLVRNYLSRPAQFAIAGPGQAEYRRRYELSQPLTPPTSP